MAYCSQNRNILLSPFESLPRKHPWRGEGVRGWECIFIIGEGGGDLRTFASMKILCCWLCNFLLLLPSYSFVVPIFSRCFSSLVQSPSTSWYDILKIGYCRRVCTSHMSFHPFITLNSLTSAPLELPSEYRIFIFILIGSSLVCKNNRIEDRLSWSIRLPARTLFRHPSRISQGPLLHPNSSINFLDCYIAAIERTLNG